MWRSLSLYGFLSLNLGFMTVGGYFLGKLAGDFFHVQNLKIVGAIIGIFLGFYELIRIALKAGTKK